jgi:hypothetical protein
MSHFCIRSIKPHTVVIQPFGPMPLNFLKTSLIFLLFAFAEKTLPAATYDTGRHSLGSSVSVHGTIPGALTADEISGVQISLTVNLAYIQIDAQNAARANEAILNELSQSPADRTTLYLCNFGGIHKLLSSSGHPSGIVVIEVAQPDILNTGVPGIKSDTKRRDSLNLQMFLVGQGLATINNNDFLQQETELHAIEDVNARESAIRYLREFKEQLISIRGN